MRCRRRQQRPREAVPPAHDLRMIGVVPDHAKPLARLLAVAIRNEEPRAAVRRVQPREQARLPERDVSVVVIVEDVVTKVAGQRPRT